MRTWRFTLATAVLAAIAVLAISCPALAEDGDPPDAVGLSPYWDEAVSRWEPIILEYAQQRNLDPDLVAAVVWKESLGRPRERSYAGAVGLMGIMPFEWRPSAEELENPWTNVGWGTRTLTQIIRDGDGDLFYSLAAYNGGWEKIHRRVPRRYASEVLGDYTRAIATRYGLPADGDWIAILAIEGMPAPNTTTVIGPHHPLARYTERPCDQAEVYAVPAGVPPHATAVTFVDEQGVECHVNVWLVTVDGVPLAPPTPAD